ncbi:ABC transporter permease [Alkalicoccus daliensis]|uniref:ABC-2 type transport system permease protein n=1 Tax=Alkalicoccus daliensis TaxID=745820 RepID=A0A1H0DLN7_9BACI|nr:ABC transporter permease [Alkalicoccus daliensis]SDN71177.1 ABC-2 type transport system permease protein [Alkalicoccus daliensis]
MSNFWTTFSHTVVKRIKSRSFAISTAIMAVLIIGIFNIPTLIDTFSGDDSEDAGGDRIIYVLDETEFNGALAEELEQINPIYENRSGDTIETLQEIEEESSTYILQLSGSAASAEAVLSGEDPGMALTSQVQEEVEAAKMSTAAGQLGLSDQEVNELAAPVTFSTEITAEAGAEPEEAFSSSYWMVYGLVFAIYLIVITFGSMIATEVATEKSSRVMELIVSSISPVTQMFGKLLGIGAAGALNLLILVAAVAVGAFMSGEEVFNFIFTEVIEVSLILYALLFIFLGYFVYGGMAAMVGALVSRAEEVNQAIQPLIFLAMIAFFLSIVALNAPELTVFRVLSYIPFFTPQLLFLRIGMGTVPVWEIWVIISILIVSAVLINLLAARVYKGGVLMYGKFSFKNGIKQALRLSKKEA